MERKSDTGKNKHQKAGLQSHNTIHHYQPAYQTTLACSFTESLTKNFISRSMERKKPDKYREKQVNSVNFGPPPLIFISRDIIPSRFTNYL